MNQSIITRINFMLDINMINESEKKILEEIAKIIEVKTKIELTEENAGVMITHIAAMFIRKRENQSLEVLDDIIIKEIEMNKSFDLCKSIINEINSKLSIQIEKVESDYIMLHLCTLLNRDISFEE